MCVAGQSTLLDLIAGRRALEAGARVEGQTTRVAFLTQEASPVAEGATMLSHLRRAWAGFASDRVTWCDGDRQGRTGILQWPCVLSPLCSRTVGGHARLQF